MSDVSGIVMRADFLSLLLVLEKIGEVAKIV